jgi:hypothetical protein
MGGRVHHRAHHRVHHMGPNPRAHRVGGRVVFPAIYTTGLGGLSATTM